MVLKHLFDPLNNNTSATTKTTTTAVDESQLPALIMVSNPTPDTLGRFLNASSHTSGICSSSTEIGWDIVSSTCTVFYVAATSQTVKEIVNYLADYSSSAIIMKKTNENATTAKNNNDGGRGDFRFKQHTMV